MDNRSLSMLIELIKQIYGNELTPERVVEIVQKDYKQTVSVEQVNEVYTPRLLLPEEEDAMLIYKHMGYE